MPSTFQRSRLYSFVRSPLFTRNAPSDVGSAWIEFLGFKKIWQGIFGYTTNGGAGTAPGASETEQLDHRRVWKTQTTDGYYLEYEQDGDEWVPSWSDSYQSVDSVMATSYYPSLTGLPESLDTRAHVQAFVGTSTIWNKIPPLLASADATPTSLTTAELSGGLSPFNEWDIDRVLTDEWDMPTLMSAILDDLDALPFDTTHPTGSDRKNYEYKEYPMVSRSNIDISGLPAESTYTGEIILTSGPVVTVETGFQEGLPPATGNGAWGCASCWLLLRGEFVAQRSRIIPTVSTSYWIGKAALYPTGNPNSVVEFSGVISGITIGEVTLLSSGTVAADAAAEAPLPDYPVSDPFPVLDGKVAIGWGCFVIINETPEAWAARTGHSFAE